MEKLHPQQRSDALYPVISIVAPEQTGLRHQRGGDYDLLHFSMFTMHSNTFNIMKKEKDKIAAYIQTVFRGFFLPLSFLCRFYSVN